ncbi:MAG: hypothetical protein ACXVPQ_03145 [Bacteroidia bacterium]
MKKFVYPSLLALALACGVIIVSCDKDPNNANSIQGTNKEQSTGTAANPNIGVVTVTGTSTLTNPATQNSALQVSGAGWSYDACTNTSTMTGSSSLTGHNGSTNVNITFGGPPPIGPSTWTLTAGNPGGGQARMMVTNAPSQPDGIIWYSKSGMLTVNTVTASTGNQTTATFNNIQCLQYTFLFPVVTVSGALICQ